MSRDTLLVERGVEDGVVWSLDNLCNQRWLEGHAPGAEAAADYLSEKASRLFLVGDTEKAVILRDAAKEILSAVVPNLKARASKHELEYPEQIAPEDLEGMEES